MIDLLVASTDREGVASPSVIYDDEHVRVILSPGESSYVLVTFGPMTNLAKDVNFFCDVPAAKLGITCLGVMAKDPNWFPADSLDNAMSFLSPILKRYSEIVCYGGSMGGYAAVKYSAKFGATTAVALCPQWSIDRLECEGGEPGFQDYYKPFMKGMGIRPEDVSGKVYILYDPSHRRDAFHADRIASQCQDVEKILVRSVAHDVITVMAGTYNFGQVVGLCRSRDVHRLRVLISQVRRKHYIRVREVCTKSVERHEMLAHKLMSAESSVAQLNKYDLSVLNSRLLSKFNSTGDYVQAVEVVDRLLQLDVCGQRKLALVAYRDSVVSRDGSGRRKLITCHGTTVGYSSLTGEIVHAHVAAFIGSTFIFPVFARKHSNALVMAVNLHGTDFLIQVGRRAQVELRPVDSVGLDVRTLIKFDVEGQSVVPSHFGGFITSRRDGSTLFHRKVAKEWEKYTFSL